MSPHHVKEAYCFKKFLVFAFAGNTATIYQLQLFLLLTREHFQSRVTEPEVRVTVRILYSRGAHGNFDIVRKETLDFKTIFVHGFGVRALH